jgi:hypothetical protein
VSGCSSKENEVPFPCLEAIIECSRIPFLLSIIKHE